MKSAWKIIWVFDTVFISWVLVVIERMQIGYSIRYELRTYIDNLLGDDV